MPSSPVILCPLQYEAAHLRRAMPALAPRIMMCGPGGAAVVRALTGLDETTVILAGLAGALDDGHPAGSAHVITDVAVGARDHHERTFASGLGATATPCRITSVAQVVTEPDERRALAEHTGANLVDLESEAFAAFAAARGLTWGIVRGVSDDLVHDLPSWVTRLTNRNGRVLLHRCLATVFAKPSRIATLRRLQRDSRRALDGVTDLLRAMTGSPAG